MTCDNRDVRTCARRSVCPVGHLVSPLMSHRYCDATANSWDTARSRGACARLTCKIARCHTLQMNHHRPTAKWKRAGGGVTIPAADNATCPPEKKARTFQLPSMTATFAVQNCAMRMAPATTLSPNPLSPVGHMHSAHDLTYGACSRVHVMSRMAQDVTPRARSSWRHTM